MNSVVDVIPCREDNYAYLWHDGSHAVLIDAPEAEAPLARIHHLGLSLEWLVNTHAHGDHIAGNLAIQGKTGCGIAGPSGATIPGITQALGEGDVLSTILGKLHVWETPGHSPVDLSLIQWDEELAFVGDTVFVGGCGRLLGGSAEQLWASIQRLRALPDSMALYCGHEYGETNLEFCVNTFPENRVFRERLAVIKTNGVWMPTTCGEECRGNPFWMADHPEIADQLGMSGKNGDAVFRRLREMRNTW